MQENAEADARGETARGLLSAADMLRCHAVSIALSLLASLSALAQGREAHPAPAESAQAPDARAALPAPARRIAWRSVSALPGMRDGAALALDPASQRIALGDARGVWLLEDARGARRVLGRGPVRDLRFRAGGELLAATDRGLYAVAPDGRVRFLKLGSGKRGHARRLAGTGEAIAVGTEEGVYFSRDGLSFARLDAGLAGGPIDALALRPRDDGFELFSASAGALQQARLRILPDGTLQVRASSPVIGDGPGARSAVDVAVDAAGAEVVVLSPEHVALLRGGRWRSVPLQLPAGGRALRIGSGAGRLWIATDAGVVTAARWEGPWRRAAPPAGGMPTASLAGDERRVLALGTRGLLEGRPAPAARPSLERPAARPSLERSGASARPSDEETGPLAAPGGEPGASALPAAASLSADDYLWRLRSEPTIRQVQTAALSWLALGPERMRSLQRGVDRRGWLPDLEIRGGTGRGRSVRFLEDQAQSSGVVYDLRDRQFDRGSDYDAALVLRWELGDLAYNAEAIDVARETREVIELRDEVLDEVTQLYFERRRVLLALRTAPAGAVESARLRLRADELAAGLDAWTGGFFSRHAPPLAGVAPLDSPAKPTGGNAP